MKYYDLFYDEEPTGEPNTNDETGFYSLSEIDNGDGTSHWHAHMNEAQKEYHKTASGKKPKAARKALKKFFKELEKEGGLDIAPRHCFGKWVFDHDEGELIFPSTKKNHKFDTVNPNRSQAVERPV